MTDLPSSYAEVDSYFKAKSKQYGSKNAFFASDEYRKVYPQISKLFDSEKCAIASRANKAMQEAGVKFGDKVEYSTASAFGEIFEVRGKIIEKRGAAIVKLDKGFKSPSGKSSMCWHKGFKKV